MGHMISEMIHCGIGETHFFVRQLDCVPEPEYRGDTTEAMEAKDMCDWLHKGIPEYLVRTARMRLGVGIMYKDIAAQEGVTIQAIQSRLKEYRKRVCKKLGAYHGEAEKRSHETG
jgi:hypothetical protein